MHIQFNADSARIGIISDTHGQVRQEIFSIFKDVKYILHAGDIGSPETIDSLEKIAPVCAVLGNTDHFVKFSGITETAFFQTNSSRIMIIHDCKRLFIDPVSADVNCIVCGHTHMPLIEYNNNILYFNPGSAGPRRFDLPVSVGILEIDGSNIHPQIIEIPIPIDKNNNNNITTIPY